MHTLNPLLTNPDPDIDLDFSEIKRRKMESPTNPRDPSSSPAAAGDPRWVILNCYGGGAHRDVAGDRVTADTQTVAESCTSTGRHFRVSMGLAPPPARSYLYHAMVGSAPAAVENDDDSSDISARSLTLRQRSRGVSDFSRTSIVAAHGDSVLFQMMTDDEEDGEDDYFVYTAGAGGAASPSRSRPPWLTLLPKSHIPYLHESGSRQEDDGNVLELNLSLSDTGLLRRGDDEILVAQLKVPFREPEPRDTAELCVLRVGGGGSGGWELKKAVPIVQEHGAGGKAHVLRDWWQSVAVIPVGDRYLCWLNYVSGFLVCDMAAEKASSPKLRYLRLPADLVGDDDEEADKKYTRNDQDPPSMKWSRNMCAAGAGAVRLVSVDSRCCCGGRIPGLNACKRSRFAFTVTSWTLNLRTTATTEKPTVAWVQDGVLDCDELWALPEYGNLPRVPLQYPVVSSDDPDVVCFRIRNDYNGYREDRKEWLVEVDIRRKRLRSVLPTTITHWKPHSDNIQAKFRY